MTRSDLANFDPKIDRTFHRQNRNKNKEQEESPSVEIVGELLRHLKVNNSEQPINCGIMVGNNNNNNDAKILKELAAPDMNLQHT